MKTFEWARTGDNPVDIHVLVHHSLQKPRWLEQTLASLEHEPVNVLLVRSDSENVGWLRATALTQGRAPFQSFVDDDDWLESGVVETCLSVLENSKLVGVYTDYHDVHSHTDKVLNTTKKKPWSAKTQVLRPYEVLHYHMWRRKAVTFDILKELAKWHTAEEIVLLGLLTAHGDWQKVDVAGYYKRKHQQGAGSRINNALLAKATKVVAPVLLKGRVGLAQSMLLSDSGCNTCNDVRKAISTVLPSKF